MNEQVDHNTSDEINKKPLVTVVMATYNGEKRIKEAINSVLNQTYKNIELIVVNDGSSDKTREILAEYGINIIVVNQEHLGVYGLGRTRNRGVREGKGTWIAFIDDDDMWLPDKIEQQIISAEKSKANFVFTNAINIDEQDRVDKLAYTKHKPRDDRVLKDLINGNYIFSSTVLISRELFERAGGFEESSQVTEDWDLWIRTATLGAKFYYLDKPLIKYLWRAGSVSKNLRRAHALRIATIKRAFVLASPELSKGIKYKATANCYATSAWFASASNQTLALKWYLIALLYDPFYKATIKGIIKCMLTIITKKQYKS